MAGPSIHQPRTLVLCFDGTGNSFADENTNVVRLFSALEKRKRGEQLCYYQAGIGTYVSPTVIWAQMFRNISKLADQAFAWYLGGHIMSGYRFLMENYKEGDKICLFGFSRGAYTARCLAGMLHKVGLLPKSNEEQIQFAWEQYKDASEVGRRRAEAFKRTFSESVDIEFLGVWDTVASVGTFGRHLSFTASNRIVKTFRHALSLDEHRAKFKPNPWHRPAPSLTAARDDPDFGTAVHGEEETSGETSGSGIQGLSTGKKRHASMLSDDSEMYDRGVGFVETDVREIWFAGCHADVGGGSVSNNTSNSLANPSLTWMVNEVLESNAGVLFKRDAFVDIPGVDAIIGVKLGPAHRRPHILPNIIIDPTRSASDNSLATPRVDAERDFAPQPQYTAQFTRSPGDSPVIEYPNPLSTFTTSTLPAMKSVTIDIPPSPVTNSPGIRQRRQHSHHSPTVLKVQQDSVLLDATAPMYDQLTHARGWWILEFFPMWQYKQDANNHWHKGFTWNRGRPREIQRENPLFHYSVRLREKYMDGGYSPRAIFKGEPQYVDWPKDRIVA